MQATAKRTSRRMTSMDDPSDIIRQPLINIGCTNRCRAETVVNHEPSHESVD
jgi:hypothetical protein